MHSKVGGTCIEGALSHAKRATVPPEKEHFVYKFMEGERERMTPAAPQFLCLCVQMDSIIILS